MRSECLLAMGFDEMGELVEEIGGIVRTRRSLGVVLDGEGGEFFVAESLDGLIVEIDVCDLDVFR